MICLRSCQSVLLVIAVFFGQLSHAVVRQYEFTISRGVISPDGVPKKSLLVNGQYPGPTIEADWNDIINVTVHNRITGPEEGTSIHWHGFLQKGTEWQDGVPGINQCPIPPGQSYTYTFNASLYGTSWYHSHYSAQYTDGLLGPIVIRGPKEYSYDVDLGPVLLTDWFRTNYTTAISNLLIKQPIPPKSINNLINGKSFANYNDTINKPSTLNPKDVTNFSFQRGKTHLLRLVNTGAEGFQHISIDNHQMTVVAVDFTPVKPYNTTVLILGTGQRTDVLVRAIDNSTTAYWMRADMSPTCSLVDQPYGLAAIYYPNANRSRIPQSTKYTYQDTKTCLGMPINQTQPLHPSKPTTMNPATKYIDVRLDLNSSGIQHYYMDNVTFVTNYSAPILNTSYALNAKGSSFNRGSNVFDFADASGIRLIVTNTQIFPHPLHLHGHVFWVLAEGTGKWDGTITNPDNPIRRDTHMLGVGTTEAPAYTVLQIEADNPGVWPFHCHAAWHLAIGMMSNILEKASSLRGQKVPASAQSLCNAWQKYKQQSGAGDTEIGSR